MNCIMPEQPYCPACKYGYIEYVDGSDTDNMALLIGRYNGCI